VGRHSRKGRAKPGDPPDRAEKRGDDAPSYGMAQSDPADRTAAPYPPDPRDGAASAPAWQGSGYGPSVRGGHPEQREPGGGWGADGTGLGPGAGRAAGRVLQGTPGAAVGVGQSSGPRQEYLEAFEDDLFGGVAGAVRAPAPRHPGRGHGPHPGRRPDAHRPGTPGPWNDYGQSDHGRPAGFGVPARAETDPWQRRGREQVQDEEERGLSSSPRASVPRQVPRTKKKGGKGRAVTGVVAAAVTTVLAVVIGGQVAGGDHFGDSGAAGRSEADRGQSDKGPASRSGEDGRDAPGVPQGAAPTYAEKMTEVLPLKADFKGKGRFTAVPGKERGAGGGQVMRYRVDVEKGLPLESGFFAQAVHKTLNDKRSWAHDGERTFERVEGGDADFVITLASSPTTDVWCAKSGLDTSEERVSCDSASTDRIMINAYRWAQGAKTFGDQRMYSYRQMLINHEVGHRIGRDHVGCPKDGALAPVMMQQTKTVTSDGAKCRPNAWPYPRG